MAYAFVKMCGRYTIVKPERIVVTFEPDRITADLGLPRYNIAPSQKVPVVRVGKTGRIVSDCVWGLVPRWSKDPAAGPRLINARSETAAEKPSFRTSFARYRCLIPADGFYEWQKTADGKQPMYIRIDDGALFAFAGLYSGWKNPDGTWLVSCSILTMDANEIMQPVHDRMPVIMPRHLWNDWLDPTLTDPVKINGLLQPVGPGRMDVYPVSKAVNSPGNDDERCVARA